MGWYDLEGVEGEGPQELPGGGVDGADIEILDEQDDGGSGLARFCFIGSNLEAAKLTHAASHRRGGGV